MTAPPVWKAAYEYKGKDKLFQWEVEGLELRECPVSLISDNAARTLNRFYESKLAQKAGGVFYGADSSRWPARWFDAVVLLEHETNRAEHAQQRALNS